jgi:hypothetical protein
MSHPSELRLEAHLLEPSREVAVHVAGCERCTRRLEEMTRAGERFRREVYPRAVVAVRDAAERPPRRWWRRPWMLPALGLATATAVAVLVVRPGQPGEDYLGTKGAALGLTVYADAPGGPRAIEDRAQVPAGAALRFSLRVPGRCRPWVASVDATGVVSQLFPPPGSAAVEVERSGPLPGGAVLDGRPGPERVYAICPARALPWDAVRAAIQRAAPPGEGAVRNAGALRGLPGDVPQSTLLLEKVR